MYKFTLEVLLIVHAGTNDFQETIIDILILNNYINDIMLGYYIKYTGRCVWKHLRRMLNH